MREEREIIQGTLTSLDLLWSQAFDGLDRWSKAELKREEEFIRSTSQLLANMKQNQENAKSLYEKFIEETTDWEKVAREELLVSTTMLQYIFPIKSYEEMNHIFDNLKKRTSDLVMVPFKEIEQANSEERILEAVEQYVEYRKNSREQFINHLKETSRVIHENQKNIMDLYNNQVKNILFPFNKYLERSTKAEPTA